MRRVAAKFIPKLFTHEQKENRLQVTLGFFNNDPNIMKKIITGDERRVYDYDSETKAQSSQCKLPSSPRQKKARQSVSDTKVMLTVFLTIEVLFITSMLLKDKLSVMITK